MSNIWYVIEVKTYKDSNFFNGWSRNNKPIWTDWAVLTTPTEKIPIKSSNQSIIKRYMNNQIEKNKTEKVKKLNF